MVVNVIYSVLLLIVGCVAAVFILFFGVKFCKDGEDLPAEVTWKDILHQLVRGYPFWMWLFAFLVFQPCIVHILSAWNPAVWETCSWIPKFSDFIGFVAITLCIILVKITDEYGRFKFLNKSKWYSKLLSYFGRSFLWNINS